jgi:hypothetical protein
MLRYEKANPVCFHNFIFSILTLTGRNFKQFELGGKFHDQGDAKCIVIRGQLRGHNDTPYGRPAPGRPIGRRVVGRPQGVYGGLSYY